MSASSASTPDSVPPINRRIALLGYPGVGKSSITLRIVQGYFPDSYDTTIEDHYTTDFKYQGRKCKLQLVDTAGQNEFSLFPRSCRADIQGYVLVYSIDSEPSFNVAKTIYEKILENVGGDHIPLVLVGNKSDLRHVESTAMANPKPKPPRRPKDRLSSDTAIRRRKRLAAALRRRNMSEEARAAIREKDRLRHELKRRNQTPEQREHQNEKKRLQRQRRQREQAAVGIRLEREKPEPKTSIDC